jgi:hypothetical protein
MCNVTRQDTVATHVCRWDPAGWFPFALQLQAGAAASQLSWGLQPQTGGFLASWSLSALWGRFRLKRLTRTA